jgi:hypothetical protein
MPEFIDLFTSYQAVGILLAVLGVLRALGVLFIKIGNLGKYAAQDNDWFDSTGAFLMKLVEGLGKVLSYLGVGNRQKKPGEK